MNERAYTWSLSTYASTEEFQRVLAKAKHWAYCIHDKDWKIDESGEKIPKETHTHILLTFAQNVSLEWIRKTIDSEQNTLGQVPKGDTIRGIWKYLIHDREDPEEKHIYDEEERICDNKVYWMKRANTDLATLYIQDSFFDDLLSDEFDIINMGRQYGRDFIKNMDKYLAYRNKVHITQGYKDNHNMLEGLIKDMISINIPMDELFAEIYNIYGNKLNAIAEVRKREGKRMNETTIKQVLHEADMMGADIDHLQWIERNLNENQPPKNTENN